MKILKSIIWLFSVVLLASCGNLIEEMTINEDGSGTYVMKSDVVEGSVNVAFEMAKMFSKLDSTKVLNEDSLRTAILDEVWADFGNEEIDSIMTGIIPDSLITTDEERKYADAMVMFFRGSREQGQVYMGMEYAFGEMADLQGLFDLMEKKQAESEGQETGTPLDVLQDIKSKASFDWDKKHFSRKTIYEKSEVDETDLDNVADMFGNGQYITIVKTAKRIKSVKGANIQSQTDHSVTFAYPFADWMAGKLNTDFEIIFE